MINNLDFSNRIKKVMDYYQFSASSFADKIGVQRSSISHILSGRNKPSLDFILKVTNTLTEVDIHWLINGKGSFPKKDFKENSNMAPPLLQQNENQNSKRIERIVVFYNDGTFDEYHK